MATNEASMSDMYQLYDTDSSLFVLWFTIFWRATSWIKPQPQMNSICLVALLGHEKVLQWILQSNKDYEIDETDENGRTALMWASQFGHEKVVQILLDRGADVNIQGGGVNTLGRYDNALRAASAHDQEKVVQ